MLVDDAVVTVDVEFDTAAVGNAGGPDGDAPQSPVAIAAAGAG